MEIDDPGKMLTEELSNARLDLKKQTSILEMMKPGMTPDSLATSGKKCLQLIVN
jgi:hypothetical protein